MTCPVIRSADNELGEVPVHICNSRRDSEETRMPVGVDALQHIVVLMMENRSFDHMLGGLKTVDARIEGVDSAWSNPDTDGKEVKATPKAEYQGQLDPDPGHHFPEVDLQLFNGDTSV